jgi:hypothetical protein
LVGPQGPGATSFHLDVAAAEKVTSLTTAGTFGPFALEYECALSGGSVSLGTGFYGPAVEVDFLGIEDGKETRTFAGAPSFPASTAAAPVPIGAPTAEAGHQYATTYTLNYFSAAGDVHEDLTLSVTNEGATQTCHIASVQYPFT